MLLQDGQSVHVRCEVLLCASVLRSPAVLFASSVGPRSLLNGLHIPVEQDPPGVRANMIDHSVLFQLFELRSSDKGLGLGHLDVKDLVFLLGMPTDCLVNEGLPRYLLERALVEDGINGAERDALMEPGRCFLEVLVLYHPLSPPLPADGTYVSTSVTLTLLSSRGSVILANGPGVFLSSNLGFDRLGLVMVYAVYYSSCWLPKPWSPTSRPRLRPRDFGRSDRY